MKSLTKTKIALCAFIIIAVAIFACNKNSKVVPTPTNSAAEAKKAVNKIDGPCPYDCYDTRCKAYVGDQYCGIYIVANSSNPYDNTGNIHNQGLDAVFAPLTSSITPSEVLTNTNIFLVGKGYDTTAVSSALSTANSLGYGSITDTTYASNPTGLVTKIYNDGAMGSTARTYFNSLFTIISDDIGDENNDTYASFASDVISLESSISSNGSLSSLEKQELLSACSVARYSFGYWGNYVITQNGGPVIDGVKSKLIVQSTKSTSRLKINKRFSWGSMGRADVIGAITGMYGGAIMGSMAGGIGAGPGAIAGTVGGAVVGSMGSALVQLWNW